MASKKRDSDRPSGTNLPMSNTTPGTPSTPNITPREPSGPGSAQRSMTPSRSTIEVPPTSSTNIHIIVKAQIVFLLSTLTKDNFERNQIEIRSLSEQHGIDIYLHFIRRLIIHSQVRLSPSAAPSAFELSTSLTFRFLIQETKRLARDPLLAGRFRDGIDKIALEDEVFRHFNLVRFSARVGLCPLEKLILAASIFSAPTRKKLVTQASRIIRVEFDSAVLELCQSPCFEQSDLSPSQVAKLMSNLLSDPPSDSPVLDATQRRALILAAQSKYGKETIAPILHRVVVCLSLPPGLSLVRVLFQLGPEITSDREVVRALLGRFNISAVQPPGENLITEIMSTLTHLATGGKTECDADVDLETWLTDNIEPQAVWPVILWVAFQVKAKYSPPTLGPPSMDGLLEIIGSTADQNLGLWQWDAADEHLLRQTFISQDSTISSWIDRYPLAWREYIRLPRSRDWARLDALTRQISRPRLDPTEYDAAIRISFIVLWTSSNPIFASQENNIILNRFVADMVENMYMVNHVPRALPQRFISCVFSCLLRKFSDDERLDDFRALIDTWKTWDVTTCLVNFRSVLSKMSEFSKLIEDQEPPKSVVNAVIHTDIRCICAHIVGVLRDPDGAYQSFFNARNGDAQQLLDLLQDLLDYPPLDSESRPIIWKAMRKLSKRSGHHPRCFPIPDFRIDGSPVTGGAFADIWKCHFQKETVCVKAIRMFEDSNLEKVMQAFRKEALIWRQLAHPNLLPFFGVYYMEDPRPRLCLVSPWMENGNVFKYLQGNPAGINRLSLVLDVAIGLAHLHGLEFVHGDLKALNVLVTRSGRAVIADFGQSSNVMLSRIPAFSSSTTLNIGGTLRWKAPEVLSGNQNSVKSDVYAFAGVSYEILTGKVPFFEVNDYAILLHVLINRKIPQQSSSISPDVWTLMEQCWDFEAENRPTARDIVARLSDPSIGAVRTKTASDWEPLYTAKFRSTLQEHTLSFLGGNIDE